MPKRVGLAAAVALFAAVGLASGPAAAAKRDRCRVPDGAGVLAKSRQLLVYKDTDWGDIYFFCVRPNGRKETLLQPVADFSPTWSRLVGDVRVAGRYAAFRYRWQRGRCSDLNPCPPGTPMSGYVVAINRPGGGPVEADVGMQDTTFGLTAGGVLAWLTAVEGGEELRVLGGPFGGIGPTGIQAPSRVVDSGAIDPASFSVRGTTLSWSNAGTPKTFSLSG